MTGIMIIQSYTYVLPQKKRDDWICNGEGKFHNLKINTMQIKAET